MIEFLAYITRTEVPTLPLRQDFNCSAFATREVSMAMISSPTCRIQELGSVAYGSSLSVCFLASEDEHQAIPVQNFPKQRFQYRLFVDIIRWFVG